MAIEMTAFRFLAPYFGTTQLIITNIIGTILLAISIGNWLGGKYGDKYPTPRGLSYILIAASLLTMIIMLINKPILNKAATALTEQNMLVFGLTLVVSVLLFSLPFVLLGMISPYAIRVITQSKEEVGKNAGTIYVLGTLGSLIGTYLPTFIFIPLIGSNKTLILFTTIIFVVGLLGLLKGKKNITGSALVLFILGAYFNGQSTAYAENVLDSKESIYNLIRIVKEGRKTKLYLNEGHGYHSVKIDDSILAEGVWDYFLGMPAMLPEQPEKMNVLIIGLAGGTISNLYTHFLGDRVHIDGVEIDAEITRLSAKHFSMGKKQLDIYHEDGRTFLRGKRGPYDIIMIDAYKQPYVPWHLTTVEFFEACKKSLKPNGLLGINVATLKKQSTIKDNLEVSLSKNFKELHNIKIENFDIEFTNNIIVASDVMPITKGLSQRFKAAPEDLMNRIQSKIEKVKLNPNAKAFTDDWAPVEWFVDLSLFDFFK